MFDPSPKRRGFGFVLSMMEVTYHSIVRSIRKSHGNALMAIVKNMMQVIIFVFAFYIMFSVLGLRGARIRGDFLVFIMSGIFLYMTHIKALGAVTGAEGPTSAMMKHAPMNTIIAIASRRWDRSTSSFCRSSSSSSSTTSPSPRSRSRIRSAPS